MTFRLLLAALLLAGCTAGAAIDPAAQGEVYARPLEDARRVLLATELPFPLQGTGARSVSARTRPDGAIALAILDADGGEQLRYTATLAAEGAEATRVAVNYAADQNAAVAANGAKHPEIVALFLKTMREQVDAQLEDRPFNNLAVGPELMVALGANAASIGADMREAGEELRRRDRANIDAAYAAEARGER